MPRTKEEVQAAIMGVVRVHYYQNKHDILDLGPTRRMLVELYEEYLQAQESKEDRNAL